MATPLQTVSFLSDYGLVDEFVGVVHSVIRSLAPHVTVVDLVHDLPPHDVRAGSLALVRAVQYVAPGLVLAIVDPGVGTGRQAIAVEVGDKGEGLLLGPDNGVLAPAVAILGGARRAFALTNTAYHLPSSGPTFAGRDIFAPTAAHLCNGVALEDVGSEIDTAMLLPGLIPLSREEDGRVVAEVLWVDRFGNCQLNVDPDDLGAFGDQVSLRMDGTVRTARRVHTYGDLGPGQIGLLVDSYGLVAIAIDRASAAEQLGLRAGARIDLDVAH